MRYPILIILMLFTTIPLSAGPRTPLLMLVNGRNVDIELVASVESILMLEVDQGTRFTALLPQGDDAGMDCRTMACAIEMGQRHAVGHVLLTTLTGLGEKILVYYQLVDVTAAEVVLQDRITAAYIEDLDAVMRRVALSIVVSRSNRTADCEITSRASE